MYWRHRLKTYNFSIILKMFKKNKQTRKQNKTPPPKKCHFMVINKLIWGENFVFNFIVTLGKWAYLYPQPYRKIQRAECKHKLQHKERYETQNSEQEFWKRVCPDKYYRSGKLNYIGEFFHGESIPGRGTTCTKTKMKQNNKHKHKNIRCKKYIISLICREHR